VRAGHEQSIRNSRHKDRFGKFLLAKAVEKASNHEEFAANVEEIGKALADHEPEMATYFASVHKHLIGRHEQDDHDPTKKGGGGHSRGQHGGRWGARGAKTGATIGAGLGALAMGRLGLGGAAAGAIGTGVTGYNIGGGQIFGNKPGAGKVRRAGAGTMNAVTDLPGTALRRLIHGNPNQRFGKSLTPREREVLSKYLGPFEEDVS
jgi:hypothetical protein